MNTIKITHDYFDALVRLHRAQLAVKRAELALNLTLAIGSDRVPDHVMVGLQAAITIRGRIAAAHQRYVDRLAIPANILELAALIFNPPFGEDRTPFARCWDAYHTRTAEAQWALGMHDAMQTELSLHIAAYAVGRQNSAYDALIDADVNGHIPRDGDGRLPGVVVQL